MTKNKDLKISITAVLLPLMLIFAMFTALSCDLFEGLNDKPLKAAINKANGLLSSTVTSGDGASVPAGSYWATSAQKAPLQGAITTAEGVLKVAIIQEELDTATTTLNSAISTFEGQRTLKPTQGNTPIGEIKGTITLTNIPATNRPKVSIGAAISSAEIPYDSEISEISLTGVTGSEATVNWSIPVYKDEVIPEYAFFSLYITPAGTTSSLRIYLENPNDYDPTIDIPEDYNVGFLGTYSIGTVVLSGTINVTHDGAPVPRVQISAHIYYEDGDIGYTMLTSPAADAPWAIVIPSMANQQSIKFSISGSDSDWSNLFWDTYEPNPEIYAKDSNISGIIINLGNKSSGFIGNLSGTIKFTDILDPPQTVYIVTLDNISSEIDLSGVSGTEATLNWRIPVYEDDDYKAMFYITLEVYESGSNKGFEIGLGAHDFLLDTPIDLGTISLLSPYIIRDPKPLTENQWENGDVVYSIRDWYTIDVTSGTYYLWWNDIYRGNGTKTADIFVEVFSGTSGNLTMIDYDNNNSDNNDSAWASPSYFTVDFTGTVYVRVDPYYGEGTYGIVYSTTNTRPALE